MLAAMVEIRVPLSIVLSSSAGLLLLKHSPFAEQNDVLQLILWHKPLIFAATNTSISQCCSRGPFLGCSISFSLLYIFLSAISGAIP